MSGSVDDVFDRPSQWRADALRALGLRGEQRVAGAVTGAGYPDALAPIVAAVAADPTCRRVCDVGAGLSAASWWIAERGATEVVAVEPKARSAQAGRSLFPDLPVVVGAAEALPLRAGSVDGVTMLGLLSLIADLDATIGEALRVVRHGGVVGVTDLCAVSEGRRRDGPAGNEFRTVDALAAALTRLGADVVSVWTAPGDLATSWDEPGERVATAMGAAHGTDEGFGAWRDDQARLHEAIDSGDLHIATLVAERR